MSDTGAVPALARNPLFEGLEPASLQELAWLMRPRRFDPGEVICEAGTTGDSLFVISEGVARVLVAEPRAEASAVARLRRGDVVGEMSLLTGEPRSATVVATTRTTVLELARDDFATLVSRHPHVLLNLGRILSRRLVDVNVRAVEGRTRGEAVTLLAGESALQLVPELLASTEAASPGPVATVDARVGADQPLSALDDLLADHRTVVLVADLDGGALPALVEASDRTVALVGTTDEWKRLAVVLADAPEGGQVDVVVCAATQGESSRLQRRASERLRVVRVLAAGAPPAAADLSWLGRHLARTKLGLALGAGGAKGYAHIGALQVLDEAGYTVDCVAGSSVGAMVGAWLALGMSTAEIDATMRRTFRPEVVDEIFKLSLTGRSTGADTMSEVLRESTSGRTFADVLIPLVVMTVDLNSRQPAPVTEGPLWEALLAATAVAGLFPPRTRDGQRLVDGLALVPVPSDAVAATGADVVVSINLLSRCTLPAWPGAAAPAEEETTPSSRMLDTLLEVMDLTQLDASEQHAARADVVITPKFGPGSWREFELADRFLEAGRQAAEEELPKLAALASPAGGRLPPTRGGGRVHS
jgi:predicted acylesterase/phospholipase RssA/CRP-like cAMP-binding protein